MTNRFLTNLHKIDVSGGEEYSEGETFDDPRIGVLLREGTPIYYTNEPVYTEGTREKLKGFLSNR